MSDVSHHELVSSFVESGIPLNETLTAMLDEHFSHRTERRGCGYTQATRHLAEYINYPSRHLEFDDARLFLRKDLGVVPRLRARAGELGFEVAWRSLEGQPIPENLLQDPEFANLREIELARQRSIRTMPEHVSLEESILLAQIIRDIVLPVDAQQVSLPELKLWSEKLSIGTCPLAEKYFLELASGFVRRRGRVNVICDEGEKPLLLEKIGLGDDHSCISIVPLVLNGVRLPPGSLIGVHYEELFGTRDAARLPGLVIPVQACLGFRFLRLTTLSVSPANRHRAFSKHYEAQVDAGLFGPGVVTLEELAQVAADQIAVRAQA